jgi:ComF family protein
MRHGISLPLLKRGGKARMRWQPFEANMDATHITNIAANWGKMALDFALPPRCVLCASMDVISVNFCLPCWGALQILDRLGCAACGREVGIGAPYDAAHLCAECQLHPPVLNGLSAATAYDDKSGAIAMRLKYGKKIGLAIPMARQMARHLPDDAADWVLVPVPLHRWRLWQRGFNQAVLLARSLAKFSGAAIVPDALIRPRRTRPLGHMNGEQRWRELSGAIAIHPRRGAAVKGQRIILIDDVVTSGATSAACAHALRRAGAKEVKILCWARVMPSRQTEPSE